LPLAPGRYAVSVGASLAGSGERKWWQIVEVKPLEWLKLLPASDQFRKTCNSSSDCSTNHICRSPRKFSARDGRPLEFSSKEGGMCEPTCNADKDCYYGTVCRVDGSEVPVANACKETVRTPPPRYSSGVQGTVGFLQGSMATQSPHFRLKSFCALKDFLRAAHTWLPVQHAKIPMERLCFRCRPAVTILNLTCSGRTVTADRSTFLRGSGFKSIRPNP
jgi:hypothetical protein